MSSGQPPRYTKTPLAGFGGSARRSHATTTKKNCHRERTFLSSAETENRGRRSPDHHHNQSPTIENSRVNYTKKIRHKLATENVFLPKRATPFSTFRPSKPNKDLRAPREAPELSFKRFPFAKRGRWATNHERRRRAAPSRRGQNRPPSAVASEHARCSVFLFGVRAGLERSDFAVRRLPFIFAWK